MPMQFAKIAVLTVACGWAAPSRGEPIAVFVSIPPQKEIVERIGAERVQTQVLVFAGKDAHTFEPSPLQAARLAKAKVYFTIGLSFEEAIVPKLRGQSVPVEIVDMTEGIERRQLGPGACEHDHDHSHAHDHQCAHGGSDPHVWLAPSALKVLAKNTAEVLGRIDPEGRDGYLDRAAELEKELDALDSRVAKTLTSYRGRAFYVFHPAYGYFADAYGLRQVSVETGGRQLAPKQLRELVAQARRDRVSVLFTQPQFDRRQADAVARVMGAKVVLVDPLADDPLETIDTMAKAVSESLRAR